MGTGGHECPQRRSGQTNLDCSYAVERGRINGKKKSKVQNFYKFVLLLAHLQSQKA